MKAEESPALEVNESIFQQQVIELAHIYGWRVAHFRPALTNKGWRTPVQADGKGFPDLVLAKPGRPIIFAEVKTERGRLNEDQKLWIDILSNAIGIKAYCWRPRDWDNIVEILEGGDVKCKRTQVSRPILS